MNADLIITETRDWPLVWNIYSDPAITERVTDDLWGSLGAETRREHVRIMVENPANHTLLVLENGAVQGCFVLGHMGDGVFEVHTLLLPGCRGARAIRAGRAAMSYTQRFNVSKLTSYCPEHLPEVHLFARLCGFKTVGKQAAAWIKHGVKYAKILVEITKEDLLKEEQCHSQV